MSIIIFSASADNDRFLRFFTFNFFRSRTISHTTSSLLIFPVRFKHAGSSKAFSFGIDATVGLYNQIPIVYHVRRLGWFY